MQHQVLEKPLQKNLPLKTGTALLQAEEKKDWRKLQRLLSSNQKIKVLPLAFDVSKKEEVFATINNLKDEWRNIDVLVNNAGLAAGRNRLMKLQLMIGML